MSKSNTKVKKFGSMVGTSKRMQEVFSLVEKAAMVDFPVFIVGETGTGKELVAREIHNQSRRSDKPFVAVNMGSIPSDLIASELFGHEKGSFTGATGVKDGLFQEASGGTLFLDEVLTMEDKVQVALLRVLEEGVFRRVGGTRDITTDVRILAATNQNPRQVVNTKQFRVDLLHRLQVIRINIPPLCKRKRDISVLVNHFLHEIGDDYEHICKSIAPETMKIIKNYSWPGNIRELRNTIYQAAVLADGKMIEPSHLPSYFLENEETKTTSSMPEEVVRSDYEDPSPMNEPVQPSDIMAMNSEGVYLPMGLSLEEVEKAYVMKTLSLSGNNKTKAAKTLGLSRKTLYDKLVRWNIHE